MKTYAFRGITLYGSGDTPDEAWEDVRQRFIEDGAGDTPDDYEVVEEEDNDGQD